MILIISDVNDSSTNQVIDWLFHLNKKYFRINSEDKIIINYCGKEISIETANNKVNLSSIKTVWYRRGFFSVENINSTNILPLDSLLSKESNNLIEFILYQLDKIRHLNSILKSTVNKLIVSDIARELGIKTPEDYIFSNAQNLTNLLENSNIRYVTKVISGSSMQNFKNFTIFNYTKLFDKIEVNTFFPSLVQNLVEKKYELRIFYLDGDFYTMAIFSQKDDKTNIDFRNYNDERPNRTVPYKLPKEIETSLHLLMNKLDLNCGSIDMIVTPKNEYFFLEVNPVGQFGMVSYPCNYNIEKRIAEYL